MLFGIHISVLLGKLSFDAVNANFKKLVLFALAKDPEHGISLYLFLFSLNFLREISDMP